MYRAAGAGHGLGGQAKTRPPFWSVSMIKRGTGHLVKQKCPQQFIATRVYRR